MKSKLRCNFAIIMLLTFINCFFSRVGLHVIPMEEIENDDFNPFNAFLNFDRMANDIMSEMQKDSMELDDNTGVGGENAVVPLDGKKRRKNSKKGRVQIEEKRTEDGMERKVVRDLGNGMKTVEITHVYNRQPNQAGIQVEDIMDPFGGMPNMGFQGMGMPTIIIGRKNLKKNRGSPIISPLHIFNELDEIFESFFDSIADSMINENSAARRNNGKSANKSEVEDDHIELDQLDLSLNETEAHVESVQKPIENKGSGVQGAEKPDKKQAELHRDLDNHELKVEDVDKHDAGKIEEHHELALVPEDLSQKENKNTDNVKTRASIKEQIAKKRQDQKNNKKTKNPYFVKTCKVMLYLISLISIYIVVKKLLEYFGLLADAVESNNNNNNKSVGSSKEQVPLKQVELSDLNQKSDKNK